MIVIYIFRTILLHRKIHGTKIQVHCQFSFNYKMSSCKVNWKTEMQSHVNLESGALIEKALLEVSISEFFREPNLGQL
jgi:hypothetical protein